NTARMAQLATEVQGSFLARLAANLAEGADWLWMLWTGPLVVLGAGGAVIAVGHRRRSALVLALLAVLPLAAFAARLSRWLPRYLLFASVPFLLLAAWTLCRGMDGMLARLPAARPCVIPPACGAALLSAR